MGPISFIHSDAPETVNVDFDSKEQTSDPQLESKIPTRIHLPRLDERFVQPNNDAFT